MAWMAVAEAAASLGVSERTIWRRIKSKSIDTRGENGRTLVHLPTGENGEGPDQQLSKVAVTHFSMRKFEGDRTSEMLAVLADYRASFDSQISAMRRSLRWLTGLVCLLVMMVAGGAWYHVTAQTKVMWDHNVAVNDLKDEHQQFIDEISEAHEAELSSQSQNLAHAEGTASARLEELVTLRGSVPEQAQRLTTIESSLGGLKTALTEQTKGVQQLTTKQLAQLSAREEALQALREQNSVLKADLQEALFLGDARMSQSNKITEYIRRSAARSIGYAEGVRQHLAYRAKKERELTTELARLRETKRMPVESIDDRESIWSTMIGEEPVANESGDSEKGRDGKVSIRTILHDCFNMWLFGSEEIGSLASASRTDTDSKR